MDAIAVDALRKRYGDVQALDGLSFSVGSGEIFALLGPNGAGKSTVVRVLTTLTRPDSGHALVMGEDVVHHASRVRRLIGYVGQESAVDLQATGRENLLLQGRLHGLGGGRLRNRVDELLRLSGLTEAADRLVRGYSGGMKRRLDVATGLMHRPRVLFLDEPTAGLDPEARATIWEEVERLARQEGLTVFLTTHYLEEADHLAERVAIASRGRVVAAGATAELKAALCGELVTVELEQAEGRAEDAASAVRQLSSTSDVASDGRVLRARVPDGPRAIPTILSLLHGRGFSITAVSTTRPSLEDVYAHFTGRDFAVEDEAGSR